MHVDVTWIAYTFIGRHLKETVLWGTITWSEMGKRKLEARKVYSGLKLFQAKGLFIHGGGPQGRVVQS